MHTNEHPDDAKADEYMSNIIQAECKKLITQSSCASNKRCFWDDDKKQCKRDGTTVTSDEQSAMSEAMIYKMPAQQIQSFPRSSPNKNTDFLVEEVSLDDPILERLADTHFLKQRKIQFLLPQETAARIDRRQKSLSTYDLGRGDLYHSNYFTDKAHFGKSEDDIYVEKINKLPIFLYAREYPVKVYSPDEYKDLIGTVSFMPDDAKKLYPMIYLPDPKNPGKELQLNANISFGRLMGGKRTRTVGSRKRKQYKHKRARRTRTRRVKK